MSFGELLRLLRVNLGVLLVCASLGLAAALWHTSREPDRYAAAATAYVATGSPRTVAEAAQASSVATAQANLLAALVDSPQTISAVGAEVGPDAGLLNLSGGVGGVTPVLTVTAIATTADGARDGANAAVGLLVEEPDRLTQTDRPQGEPYAQLVQVRELDAATSPAAPFAPTYTQPLLVGAGLGLVAGLVLALLRRAMDSRIRTTADVDEVLNVGTLGVLPESVAIGAARRSLVPGATRRRERARRLGDEATRQLRTNVRFWSVDRPPRSLVVTGPTAGEGKTSVALALARSMALAAVESGGDAARPIVLIDGDLRRPTLAERRGVPGTPGLAEVLARRADLEDALHADDTAGLALLPAGGRVPNPSELVGSDRMGEVLATLTRDHFVIIDSPPLLPVTDAGLLGVQADGVLLVLRPGRSGKVQAEYCRRVLGRLDVPLAGVVLNRVPPRRLSHVRFGRSLGLWRRPDPVLSAGSAGVGETG